MMALTTALVDLQREVVGLCDELRAVDRVAWKKNYRHESDVRRD
jgi:hypothetical protein